ATARFLLRTASVTRPYQLGLITHRFTANVILGYVAFLITVPAAYLLYALVLVWVHPEAHPLEKLATGQATTVEMVLIVLEAVVAAPIWEELLFRGIVQK